VQTGPTKILSCAGRREQARPARKNELASSVFTLADTNLPVLNTISAGKLTDAFGFVIDLAIAEAEREAEAELEAELEAEGDH
jgi:hypothetical protein